MFRKILPATAVVLTLLGGAPAIFAGDDKAPMPQTRGMQGMDPKLHDQAAKGPYEGCVLNPDKAAQQAKHPMPDTKGMKGMDPKAHTMDCPEGNVRKTDKATHVHKAPGG
jgi:hypothetical protein